MEIINSCIITCLSDNTIGTKVTDLAKFNEVLYKAVSFCDFEAQRQPGQGFIMCPELIPYISAGVGRATDDPNDYVKRSYRGRVRTYLKREKAAVCEGAALVVFTRDAYLADPETKSNEQETVRIKASSATHVLVAVLGYAGPKAPLSPEALVHNLAGHNNEALKWSADEIRAKAKESDEYHSEWSVVAD